MLKWINKLKNQKNSSLLNHKNEKNNKSTLKGKNGVNFLEFIISKGLAQYEGEQEKNVRLTIEEYVRELRYKLKIITKNKSNPDKIKNENTLLKNILSNNYKRRSNVFTFDNNSEQILNSNISNIINKNDETDLREFILKKYSPKVYEQIHKILKQRNSQTQEYIDDYGQKLDMVLHLSQIPFRKFDYNYEQTLEELEYIFGKRYRNMNDLIYLQHFLSIYNKYLPLVYNNFNIGDRDKILFNMAKCINCKQFKKNEILFHYGDYCDQCFFFLKGKVSLLTVKEQECMMTLNQYAKYLNQLEQVQEYELIKKIIEVNKIYKNEPVVNKIKSHVDKKIQKEIASKTKQSKNITKNQDYASIEINPNFQFTAMIMPSKGLIQDNELIDINSYINRIIPPFLIKKNDTKIIRRKTTRKNSTSEISTPNKVIFYEYYLFKQINNFELIGNVSLEEHISLNREYTAICDEDSEILFLDVNNFIKYEKLYEETIYNKNLSAILDVSFFRDINKDYFKEKLFEHFNLYHYNIGDMIFNQNDKRKYVYFIKSGEIELNMNASIFDINYIINNKFQKFLDNSNTFSKKYEDKYYHLINFYNNSTQKINWRILSVFPKEIIGLDEMVNDNKFLVSAKVKSFFAEIYIINYKKFLEIINSSKRIKNLFEEFSEDKNLLFMNRLKTIKNTHIQNKIKELKNITLIWDKNIKLNKLKEYNKEINMDSFKSLAKSISDSNINIGNTTNLNDETDDKTKIINNMNSNNIMKKSFSFNWKNKQNNNLLCSSQKSNKWESNIDLTDIKRYKTKIKNGIYKCLTPKNINPKKTLVNIKKFNSCGKERTFHISKTNNSKYLFKLKNFIESPENKSKKNVVFDFKNYLKKVKNFHIDNRREPTITPFSNVLFSMAEIENQMSRNTKRTLSSTIFGRTATTSFSSYFPDKNNVKINNIECLIFDKIIDNQGYENNDKNISKNYSFKPRNKISHSTFSGTKKIKKNIIKKYKSKKDFSYSNENL